MIRVLVTGDADAVASVAVVRGLLILAGAHLAMSAVLDRRGLPRRVAARRSVRAGRTPVARMLADLDSAP